MAAAAIEMLEKLKAEYESSYEELSSLKNEIVRFGYSKGGKVFFRGMYTPYLSYKYGLISIFLVFSYVTEESYRYDNDELAAIQITSGDTRYPTRYHSSYENNDKSFRLTKQWITKLLYHLFNNKTAPQKACAALFLCLS